MNGTAEAFLNVEGQSVCVAIAKAIQQNRDYLSEVDGLIGDGDHGINMNKGFTMFLDRTSGMQLNFSESLRTLSKTLMEDIGGSMGPLYGTLFMRMARVSKDCDVIDAAVFGKMITSAREGVQAIGNAQPGDKTLVDCLFPAEQRFVEAINAGMTFKQALSEMKTAAQAGRDSTTDMIAKLGRASRLGERSRSVPDAGATSCCIILCAMADAIAEIVA